MDDATHWSSLLKLTCRRSPNAAPPTLQQPGAYTSPGLTCLSVRLDDLVQRGALGRRAAGAPRRVDQLLGLEPNAVVRAGHPRDVLLHQRAAEVVDAPAQALGGGVEAHLHPARLDVGNRAPEREPERRRVLEVVLARDLLDTVGSSQQRVEGDEAQRDELRDPPGALLELAHHPHVGRELRWLLDMAEHHRRARAQAGAVAGLDDLDPPRDRQLVGRDPLT